MCPLFHTGKYNINKIRLWNYSNLLWSSVTSFSSWSGLVRARPRIKFSDQNHCESGHDGFTRHRLCRTVANVTMKSKPPFPQPSSTYRRSERGLAECLTRLVALRAAWLCGINICRQLGVWAGAQAAMPQRTAPGSSSDLLALFARCILGSWSRWWPFFKLLVIH